MIYSLVGNHLPMKITNIPFNAPSESGYETHEHDNNVNDNKY